MSLAGAESVDASEPVELDNESSSAGETGNVSLIQLRYSITSSVIRIIRPSILLQTKVHVNVSLLSTLLFSLQE